jgi:polygalacturonase
MSSGRQSRPALHAPMKALRGLPRIALLLVALCAVGDAAAAPPARKPAPTVYDVRGFGALPDGKTKATEAVRKAIAAAVAAGGGTVVFAGGTYLSGPIHLKSNITLQIEAGTVLKFSSDFDDYLPMVRSRWEGTEVVNFSPLIYGDKVENVAITGRGTIDGNGEPWWKTYREIKDQLGKPGAPRSKWQEEFARRNTARGDWPDDRRWLENGFLRPPLIQILDGKNVLITDVTLKNPPFWTINPVYCDGVVVRGITIDNPEDSPNTDGINPESSRNVHISDSNISTGDDCIAIKSGRDAQGRKVGRPTENVTITNCAMLRGHGGVSIGSEMAGSVRRVAISNCVFSGTQRGIRIKSTRGRGGIVEDVRVSNIVVRDLKYEAVAFDLHYTAAPQEPVSERTPRVRNIHVSAITGTARGAGLLFGLEESPLQEITLTDIDLVAEKGLVIRNADHVSLRSVRIDTKAGPAVIADGARDLRLFDVGTLAPHVGTATIELGNVQHAFVQGCFASPGSESFLSVRGRDTREIIVGENDLGAARTPVVFGADVDPRAVQGPIASRR